MNNEQQVKIWEETITIPTYDIGEPNQNPMFLEKRVYQGSSGVVYPHPVIDKIHDEKMDKEYDVIFLENQYLKLMVMPSLGGRIQMAYDKTNDYHFVYNNQVIKPALVGLAGPWISGGIEFNWPQHHRPSTFDPVDYRIEENSDGSMTLWVSEVERMFRTKGMAGFTIHPDKAYLEIKGKLYNRTAEPQTFLWWANPAVAVHDEYKSIFPPDVHAVFDHGKRDVSTFPIATGEYYKVDYSAGVDISLYKNLPVPTSYMVYHSDYDFVGCYDFNVDAGLLHVADHHISPGKKQWTWGKGDFGIAWDRNLTDEDGPYIELMTGVYTDNQPDFSWLQPFEEKSFTQYFMPYKQTGGCTCATIDCITNLEFKEKMATLSVYTTSAQSKLQIKLYEDGKQLFCSTTDCSPTNVFNEEFSAESAPQQYELVVCDENGVELLRYQPEKDEEADIPEAAQAAVKPEQMETNEELYLTGLHLEQYRHATFRPEDYYLEALKRDPSDARCNNSMGLLQYRSGNFQVAEEYFRASIKKITWRNPNPYDGEAYYNLGLALRMQDKLSESFDAFYKSCWNAAWKGAGYFSLAQIAATQGKNKEALELVDQGLVHNWHNHKARHLKISLLRITGAADLAKQEIELTLSIDPLDYGARNELYLITQDESVLQELKRIMRNNVSNYLELAIDYYYGGFFVEAYEVLERILATADSSDYLYPLLRYYLGFVSSKSGSAESAKQWYNEAATIDAGCCFPNRLETLLVLADAIKVNPNDGLAYYHLGNLLYGKRNHEDARLNWEKSAELNDSFPTVFRNLALAYFNKTGEPEKALQSLERAFQLNPNDSRVMFELDSLYKRLNRSPKERLEFMNSHPDVVADRDDFYIEYITIHNLLGKHQEALAMIDGRKFHPWEGGEGKVTGQFIGALVELAKQEIAIGNYQKAIDLLKRTESYPHNLGEGKLIVAQENNINYYFGVAFAGLNDKKTADSYINKAATGLGEPSSAMYYNDQPPEMIFYQGLALIKLGDKEQAANRFDKLIEYGENHLNDEVEIDYFAVSLPDFLIWEEDLNKCNRIHCYYMMALGYHGLAMSSDDSEKIDLAKKKYSTALNEDVSHLGVTTHYALLQNNLTTIKQGTVS